MKLHTYRLQSKSKLNEAVLKTIYPNKSILVPSSGKTDSKTLLEELSVCKGNKRGNLKAAIRRAMMQQGFNSQQK